MPYKGAPSKEELLGLLAEQKTETDISALPYKEQQDFVLDSNHPLRKEMRERNRLICEGLIYHELDVDDLDLE